MLVYVANLFGDNIFTVTLSFKKVVENISVKIINDAYNVTLLVARLPFTCSNAKLAQTKELSN